MPSLKAIRKRITSVKNTQKITKAMKMVAAAKLRRAQDAVQKFRPYARALGHIAGDVAEHLLAEPTSSSDAPSASGGAQAGAEADGFVLSTEDRSRLVRRLLVGQREQRILLVVVSADRGLVGAYNSNLFRRVERFVVEEAGKPIELFLLGKKGREYFRRRPFKILKDLPGASSKTVVERSTEVAKFLSEALLAEQADAIYVLYNEFKSVSSQPVKLDRLLPLRVYPTPAPGAPVDDEPKSLIDFEYEPNRDEVLGQLLPLYLQAELQRILLEAIAAEFGASMRAMDSASRNAKEMISRLTLQYNRARQAAITKELLEIIGGAEALKG